MFQNIPGEMRSFAHWVLADLSINPATGLPSKLPLNPRTGRLASVTDPTTWGTFEEAINTGYQHIGFVLTRNDPYTIIDLDNKPHNPATQIEIERHHKILQAFDSYTERSISRLGYHLIIKGAIAHGVHRDKVELYSEGRYMIMTGDVVNPAPIVERQALLDMLYYEMTAQQKQAVELIQVEGLLSDADIVDMAMNAVNGAKYTALCNMDASLAEEYPSQSEADFALLSMLAFYTRDNEQVRRLFRMTALGKRPKATKNNDYLNRCLGKIRGAEVPEVDLSQLVQNAGKQMEAAIKLHNHSLDVIDTTTGEILTISAVTHGTLPTGTSLVPASALGIAVVYDWELGGVTLPPGIIGALAQHFYHTAIRPVPQIALAGAIACIAGIVGRSYNISGTGLNQYIVLLAGTGKGKEAIAKGITKLFAAVRPRLPMIDQFLGPSHFASGQALKRILNEKPCFVSVLGEFGITLQQITSPGANSAERMIKATLLDAFNKSGWTDLFGATVYSDIEKTVLPTQAPNVTIVGESTPESFYDWLDPSHIADGLIPRFSIIEYLGERPERNRHTDRSIDPALLQQFMDLVTTAITITNNNTCCPVSIGEGALALTDAYDRMVDGVMRKSEINAQLWNRAHLKVLKLAALLAVGINPHAPVVTPECAQWAIDFTEYEIKQVSKRFEAGDVGHGDNKQIHDMRRAIEFYITAPPGYVMKDPEKRKMHDSRVVPHSYLSQRLISVASFRNDRLGATVALKRTIQSLLDNGELIAIPPAQIQKLFGYAGSVYGIGKK